MWDSAWVSDPLNHYHLLPRWPFVSCHHICSPLAVKSTAHLFDSRDQPVSLSLKGWCNPSLHSCLFAIFFQRPAFCKHLSSFVLLCSPSRPDSSSPAFSLSLQRSAVSFSLCSLQPRMRSSLLIPFHQDIDSLWTLRVKVGPSQYHLLLVSHSFAATHCHSWDVAHSSQCPPATSATRAFGL